MDDKHVYAFLVDAIRNVTTSWRQGGRKLILDGGYQSRYQKIYLAKVLFIFKVLLYKTPKRWGYTRYPQFCPPYMEMSHRDLVRGGDSQVNNKNVIFQK